MQSIIDHLNSSGVLLDKNALSRLIAKKASEKKFVSEEIKRILGKNIDVEQMPQLVHAMYRLGIYPTDATLEYFKANRNEHQIYSLIYQYKKLSATHTNLSNIANLITPNGRLYGTWIENSCLSGRMTCKKPNLQALSADVRECIIPNKGFSIIKSDYSQIELRILAQMSCDENLIKGFRSGQDVHTHTASLIFSKPQSEISEEERQVAKKVNFGIIYGISARGLQEQLAKIIHVTIRQCDILRNNFYESYPQVLAYQDRTLRAQKLCSLGSQQWESKNLSPSQRLNISIQASGAEILKQALKYLFKRLHPQWKIINVIHDEIWLEVPVNQVDLGKQTLTDCMRHGFENHIRLLPCVVETTVKN